MPDITLMDKSFEEFVGEEEHAGSKLGDNVSLGGKNPAKTAAEAAVDAMFGMLEVVGTEKTVMVEQLFESTTHDIEQFEQYPDAAEQVGKAFAALPARVGLVAEKQTIRLSSDDFVTLFRSLPGFEIPEGSSVSGLKALVVEGNELRFEGESTFNFTAPDGKKMQLNLKDFKGRMEADPSDPTKLTIVDITGLKAVSAENPLAFIQIKGLAISVKEVEGKNVPVIQITKHLLGGLAVVLPPEQKEAIGVALAAGFPLPVEDPQAVSRLVRLVDSLSKWSSQAEQKRDAGNLVESFASMFVGESVTQLFKGAKDVQKDGDTITIVPSEHMPLPAGLPIAFEKSISGRLVKTGQKLAFTDIEGAIFKIDLPTALAAQLGMPEKLQLKSIELGQPDLSGNRVATMKLGGAVEGAVTIIVRPDMRPLNADDEGNICARIEINRDGKQIAADLTFNPAGSEGKTRCSYEQILRREPDPARSWAVAAFERGESFKMVAKAITTSDEFRDSIPANEAEIVPFLYRRLLNREFSSGEDKGVWSKILREKGVDAVIEGLLNSDEFARKHPDIKLQIKLNGGAGTVADVLQTLAGGKLDPAVTDFFRGAESATMTQDGRVVVQHSAEKLPPGLPISFDKTVSAKVSRDGEKMVLSDIHGVVLKVDFAEAVPGKTGLQGAPVKSFEFSRPDAKGNRLATLKLGGVVESQCQILIGADLQPVVVDNAGNIALRVELRNGDNIVASDVRVNPSGVPDKVKRVYEQVLGRQPDAHSSWADAAFARGDSYKSIVQAIINNPEGEFRKSIPEDKSQIVPFLYKRLHNRDYVPGEDNGNWNKVLDQYGVDSVIEGILDSDEFKRSHPDSQISVNVGTHSSAGNVLEALTGRPLDHGVKEFVQGVVRLAITHDGRVHVHRDNATRLGNLPLVADGATSFKQIADNSVDLAVESVGIKANLPIPSEILSKLGCPSDAPVKLTILSKPDADGNRIVELKFDHPVLKSVSIMLDKNGAPLIDNDRVRGRLSIESSGKILDCQIDAPSGGGLDKSLYIAVTGDPAAKVELLKRLGAPPELAEVAGGVSGIKVEGKSVSLHFGSRQNVTVKGMSMEFDRVVTVTAMEPSYGLMAANSLGMNDIRMLSVSGVQINGFDFGGSGWGLASARLHQFLYNQNDLPIKLNSLTFGECQNGRFKISFSANAGGLKSGTFLLESKDNPAFVNGWITVKNPLRNLAPTGAVFGGGDHEMTVELTGSGLANPQQTVVDAMKPIINDPVIRAATPPPVRFAIDLAEWINR